MGAIKGLAVLGGVDRADAGTLAAAGIALGIVALTACASPALRAVRVDVNAALKQD